MNGRAFRFADLAALRSGVKPEIMHEVATVAASQHGALSVSQARELGLRRKAMYRAIELGLVTRVHSGVLVIAGAPDTWMRRLQIGLLALDGDGWISHRSAARLHGLDRFRGDDLDFTVLRGRRGARGVRALHTTDNVGPLDVVTVNGLRCTSATRTIIDLAYTGTPESQLGPAIDSAVRLGLSAPTALARRLSELRGRGRRGARTLDALLLDSGGETVLERAFLRLMRQAGLPRPATQVVRRRGGEHVARVDHLRALPHRGRGEWSARPCFADRAGQGRAAPQRADRPRLSHVRVHVVGREWTTRPCRGHDAHPSGASRLAADRSSIRVINSSPFRVSSMTWTQPRYFLMERS